MIDGKASLHWCGTHEIPFHKEFAGEPQDVSLDPVDLFAAVLADGSSGIYRLDPDGQVTQLLKSGTKTEWGTITHLALGLRGESHGLQTNSKGQIATVVDFDDGPDTIVLLTPPAP